MGSLYSIQYITQNRNEKAYNTFEYIHYTVQCVSDVCICTSKHNTVRTVRPKYVIHIGITDIKNTQ